MSTLTKAELFQMVNHMADVIIENEVPFCELDAVAGDGDFGMSIAKGFKMLKAQWETLNRESIGEFLADCSMIISENCGGASGPIWGAGFKGASKATTGLQSLTKAEFASMLESAAELIQKRGKANRGDKTLLDALLPCVDALNAHKSDDNSFKAFLQAGAFAATEGAEATKHMIASRGRASYVGERSLEFPDAGAMALSIIFTAVSGQVLD